MSKDNPEKHSPIEPETNQLFCGRCGKPAIRGKNIGDHCGQFFDIEKNGMFCSGTIVEPDTPLQPVKDEIQEAAKKYSMKGMGIFDADCTKEYLAFLAGASFVSSPPEPSREALERLYPFCHEDGMKGESDWEKAWLNAEAVLSNTLPVQPAGVKDMNELAHQYAKEKSINGVDYKIVKKDFIAGYKAASSPPEPSSKEQEGNQDELWKEVVEIADGYIVDFAVSRFETDYGIGGGVIDELKQKFQLYKKKP